jgi:hypothetical protein
MPILCPWCGNRTEITPDGPAESQEFVKDCIVCCNPIVVCIRYDPLSQELVELSVRRENE